MATCKQHVQRKDRSGSKPSTRCSLPAMRTCIKTWIRLNFDQTAQLTTELAAIERIKIDVTTFSQLLYINQMFFKRVGIEDIQNMSVEFKL